MEIALRSIALMKAMIEKLPSLSPIEGTYSNCYSLLKMEVLLRRASKTLNELAGSVLVGFRREEPIRNRPLIGSLI